MSKGKKLSDTKTSLRNTIEQAVAEYAATKVKAGVDYPTIEQDLKTKGIVDYNGKFFHNAKISAMVIKKFPELRQRKERVKKVKATSTDKAILRSLDTLAKLLKK